ncbi:GNAT family N-acetyltransferase [Sinomonas sp. G460-2]|uniref:GNAT family N-acetyltransferase n=1 Tax=unclassified Sinomonas TaxID=2646595 RepID=UPI0039EE1C4C
MGGDAVRRATPGEAVVVAELLDAFNREFESPTPGIRALAARLVGLLGAGDVVALLVGEPAVGLAVLTFRPNVWFDGPVALLDELYVEPARRGEGLGGELLAAAEALVRERGAELLEINVDGEDVDARRFYERHGYANHEPGQTEAQLYYFKELSGP